MGDDPFYWWFNKNGFYNIKSILLDFINGLDVYSYIPLKHLRKLLDGAALVMFGLGV